MGNSRDQKWGLLRDHCQIRPGPRAAAPPAARPALPEHERLRRERCTRGTVAKLVIDGPVVVREPTDVAEPEGSTG
ncbi:MAG: hypothetical protein MSC31_05115 [Solirubrobacteraceae bacterium MAG38_C4-C5]|nr:hypothetical protein [Candidatus Siliceabacter maunaloa]